jgi:hypothetical protein
MATQTLHKTASHDPSQSCPARFCSLLLALQQLLQLRLQPSNLRPLLHCKLLLR